VLGGFPVELLKRIQELLRTKDVTAEFESDGELGFLARTGPISVRIRINVRESAIIVTSFIPLFTPAERRAAMCEAISLANFNLRFARFEMDAEDGELRCRADFPLYDGVPTDQQLTRLTFSVWSISERYAAALVDVMMGQSEPAIAIARVEQPEIEPIRRKQERDLTVN
jgi:hypothetical protein